MEIFLQCGEKECIYINISNGESPPGISFMRNLYAKLFNPEAKLG